MLTQLRRRRRSGGKDCSDSDPNRAQLLLGVLEADNVPLSSREREQEKKNSSIVGVENFVCISS